MQEGAPAAPTMPKQPNLTTALLTLIVLLICPWLCFTTVSFGRDIFHNAGDRVREHLNSLNPKKPGGGIHDKWAFMVGVSKYQDKEIRPMKAARNNAMLLSSTLKEPSVGRFGNGHVAEVVGASATRDAILGALFSSALIKKSLPSDLIVLYFSGRTLLALDKNDICLCAYDTLSSEPELSGISLKETLASFKRRTQCSQIVCILDCSPNQESKANKGECLKVEDLAKATGVSVLSANVLDAESYACGSGTISCFTQFLTEGLKDSQGFFSIAKLADFVQTNITQEENQGVTVKQKVVFASPPGNDRAGDTVIGTSIATPWNISKFTMGHNVQTLAYTRPDLISTPSNNSAAVTDFRPLQRALAKDASKEPKIVAADTPVDEGSAANSAPGLDSYIANAKGQIKQKCHPPKGLKEHQVVTTFTVLKNGLIVDPVVTESSGDGTLDQGAIDALKAVSPLAALPKGAPNSIQIRYIFDGRVPAP
jgi:TonB family protein